MNVATTGHFFFVLEYISVIYHWKGIDETITNMHFFFKSDNGLKSYCPLKFEPKQYFLPAFWDSGLSLFFFNFLVKT